MLDSIRWTSCNIWTLLSSLYQHTVISGEILLFLICKGWADKPRAPKVFSCRVQPYVTDTVSKVKEYALCNSLRAFSSFLKPHLSSSESFFCSPQACMFLSQELRCLRQLTNIQNRWVVDYHNVKNTNIKPFGPELTDQSNQCFCQTTELYLCYILYLEVLYEPSFLFFLSSPYCLSSSDAESCWNKWLNLRRRTLKRLIRWV